MARCSLNGTPPPAPSLLFCADPSHQLRLIPSQYQSEFIDAPDVRWADHNATVRVIGPGAGNFTYVLMDNAGHFVSELPFY